MLSEGACCKHCAQVPLIIAASSSTTLLSGVVGSQSPWTSNTGSFGLKNCTFSTLIRKSQQPNRQAPAAHTKSVASEFAVITIPGAITVLTAELSAPTSTNLASCSCCEASTPAAKSTTSAAHQYYGFCIATSIAPEEQGTGGSTCPNRSTIQHDPVCLDHKPALVDAGCRKFENSFESLSAPNPCC